MERGERSVAPPHRRAGRKRGDGGIEEVTMSPHDIQAALPEAPPPQFYPAPVPSGIRLPRADDAAFAARCRWSPRAWLFGVIAGAMAAIALLPDRGVRVRSVFDMQTQAVAGDGLGIGAGSVRGADACAAGGTPGSGRDCCPAACGRSVSSDRGSACTPLVQKAAPKPKRKVARQSPRERNVSAAEPDPRSAHAGPFRRYAEPQRDGMSADPSGSAGSNDWPRSDRSRRCRSRRSHRRPAAAL